ncbi:MAG: hypothetical protein NTZ39_02885 [Methanoregula sp.]|nr:hypothetical protein [Methanoregula sp.]
MSSKIISRCRNNLYAGMVPNAYRLCRMMQLLRGKRAHDRIAGMLLLTLVIAGAAAIAAAPALTQPSHHKIPALAALVSANSTAPAVTGIVPASGNWGLPTSIPDLSGTVHNQTVIPETALPETSNATGTNGTISPHGVTTVTYGSSQTYAITPDTGYHIADVLVDSVSIGMVSVYAFTDVQANHTIAALFAINTNTITASAGSGGTVAPPGRVPVAYNNSQRFAITPDTGYHTVDVVVDGISAGVITSYTFTDVQTSHTLFAAFAINTSTITASAGRGGTVAPSGAVSVDYGRSQTFEILPDNGYHIVSVTVDGSSFGAVPGYTFSNVVSPHTITAVFSADPTITNINPVSGKNGKTRPFTIDGTGFVGSGTTRVALYYPGTTTVFVDGDSILVTSPNQIAGQFVLPVSPSHRFYDIKVTNPDGSSDIRPYGFEVT